MAPYKWSDAEVETFLTCYKQYECLWNINIPEYKDTNKKKRAYVQLRNSLEMKHLTLLDVKNKIKGFRTTYNEELNKILNSQKAGDGVTNVYEPKLFWFKLADSFLRGVTEKKKTSPKVEEKVVVDLPTEQEVVLVQEDTQKEDNCEAAGPSGNLGTKFGQIEKAANEIDDASKTKDKEADKDEDEFDFFGRSVAIQLKKLPELDALELMQQMQMAVIYKKRQILQSSGYPLSRKRANVERALCTPSPARSISSSPTSMASPRRRCNDAAPKPSPVHKEVLFMDTQINAINALEEHQKDIAESVTNDSQPHSTIAYKSIIKKSRR